MSQLSKETVEEFRRIFKQDYGVEYTYEEAWEVAHNLVGFFDLLLQIDQRQKERNSEQRSEVKNY